jgi:isoamylase
VDRLGAFFDIIHQDPMLSQVKLIAEPWDLGEGGYQVGNFPVGWAEWNDRYRDVVRAYWKGDGGLIGELAHRVTGSSDLYARSGRRPYASINFVTAHDGFTLEDLVSHNHKHNEANLEENRDGSDNNLSWNCGAEGPTDDRDILALRACQKRNLLATLLLSQGVPMFVAGDVIGRTQHGNNNAYCQDNEISWVNWQLDAAKGKFLAFVRRVVQLRREHAVFHRQSFFQGRRIRGGGTQDILWLRPDGGEMTDKEWGQSFARCLGVLLAGEALDERDERGRPVKDANFLLLMNAHHERVPFAVPAVEGGGTWLVLLDTHHEDGLTPDGRFAPGGEYPLEGRSLALMVQLKDGDAAVSR